MNTSTLKNESKIFMSSRTLGEIAENIPWRWVYFVLFLPVLAFVANPIIKMTQGLINPPSDTFCGFDIDYGIFITSSIDSFALITGICAIILLLIKNTHEKVSLKSFASKNIPFVLFFILVLLMIVSTIINGFDFYAINGDTYRRESLFSFILYFMVFFFCASQMKSINLKALLVYIYQIASLFVGICALIHTYIVPLDAFIMNAGLATIFSNSNHYGYFLLIAICLSAGTFIFEKNIALKIFSIIIFILNNVVLIINDTFGCWLAAAITLIMLCTFLSIWNKKFNFLAAVPFAIFLLIAFIMGFWYYTVFSQVITLFIEVKNIALDDEDAYYAGSGRWNLWTHTAGYISEKPLFGYGVEGIADRLAEDTGIDRPHNEYLQYSAFFGIPAGIVYILALASAFIKCLRNHLKLDVYSFAAFTAAFGYAVSACFGNTMYYTAPFFFIFLGVAVAYRDNLTSQPVG